MRWEIEFYETADGEIPVKEFIDKLPPKARAKVARAIDLLEEYGLELKAPHVKASLSFESGWLPSAIVCSISPSRGGNSSYSTLWQRNRQNWRHEIWMLPKRE